MPNTDVSSLGGGALLRTTQTSFDVRQESDVIALLRTIHVNAIDPDLKNHLRDLIFAYRQSISASDLESVASAFKELGITIVNEVNDKTAIAVGTPDTVVPQKKPSFISTSRPQPRFVTAVSKPLVKSVIEPIGVPSYNEDVIVPPTKDAPAIPQVVAPLTPQSATEPVIEVPVQKTEVVVPAPTSRSEAATVSYANPTDRIKEIKHQVNEKVGNPINLIDAHNEIGREYMNALLDAMKKSNGGQLQEVSEAMGRLEKAFAAVLTAIGQGSLGASTSSLTPVQSVTPSEPAITTMPEIQPVGTKAPQVEPQPTNISSNPVKIKIVQEEVADGTEVVTAPAITQSREETVVAESTPSPHFPSVAQNLASTQVQKEVEVKRAPTTPVPAAVIPMGNPNFHSVAEDKTLQDSIRIQREDISKQLQKEEATKVSQMDPLQTPEVTAGLGQLLSEWSLFKSSGIFGTGPSGKDHVLYLKLAPLTMSAVIAGRFEGVTPKIKQSIADYMNGWRYEEGVAHEHGETFEHYLRRVIHHILNKQKQAN